MDRTSRFQKAYPLLQAFYDRWMVPIDERCRAHDHRRAAYYIWARYSMSIGTVAVLQYPQAIPDLSVICRGCIEYDVSLEAVMKDEEIAREYLDFEKHARAHYLQILSKQGEVDRLLMRREQFDEAFGEDPDQFRHASWCAKRQGISGLMRSLNRTTELRLYNMLSHFAHGSIWAMQTLEGSIKDAPATLRTMTDGTFDAYTESSRRFIWFIWEPIATPDGEACKAEFAQILSA